MKIQEQDIYHGAALTQIVEHPSFKALNRADEKYGHYLINHDRRIFVKYRTNSSSPWTFTFQQNELRAIQEDIESGMKVFVCLICGQSTVCAIDCSELNILIDLETDRAQRIKVINARNGSMWLEGTKNNLTRSIRHNSFPSKLFDQVI